MNDPLTSTCSAIVFYGLDVPDFLAGFFRGIEKWASEVGLQPDKAAIDVMGKKPRWNSVKHINKTVDKFGFAGVTSISMVSMIPKGRIPLDDYYWIASASTKYSYADLVCRTSLKELTRHALLPIARAIAESTGASYGIGYSRRHRLGPNMYAIGIAQGLGICSDNPDGASEGDEIEASRISHWGHAMRGRLWDKGLLRDVYPWNFLSPPLLEAPIEGLPLSRWIERDPARGKLEPFANGMVFWEVDTALISGVREALEKADLLFDWKKHVLSGKYK
jgi:hypothetical protein